MHPLKGERRFNLGGAISVANRERSYFVSTRAWNTLNLMPRVLNEEYVVLRGPWQCGKLTRVVEFSEQLEAAGYVPCLYVGVRDALHGLLTRLRPVSISRR